MFGLGFQQEEIEFYSIEDGLTAQEPGLFDTFFVKWDSQVYEHHRAIYTFLDLLADVGGLFDMLKLIGEILIGMIVPITGSRLSKVLIEELFYLPKKRVK